MNSDIQHLIDPATSLQLIKLLSWALILLGIAKMVIYGIGECFPGAYAKIKSEQLRKFLTGKGNRLLFGLGGFITALLGLIALGLGYFLAFLFRLPT
ncbi:MAG: hypothetical protein P1U68_04240 [Verrucomicrobiales bacterium]|nr:hypothetical protein [Verrucomicrobiales bacterium]